MQDRSNILAAGGLTVFVNGRRYGVAEDFSFSVDSPREALHCIDIMQPFELMPTTTKVTVSMSVLRQSLDGGAQGYGLTASLREISREKYFSVALVEPHTDTVMFQAQQCSLNNQQWQIRAKGLMRGTVSFECIDYQSETDLLR